jgi:hypothetical protein
MNDVVVMLKQEVSYRIKTKVKKVYQEEVRSNWRKTGEKTECDTKYGGWYVSLEGSYESLYLGDEKPVFEPGMDVYITISQAK